MDDNMPDISEKELTEQKRKRQRNWKRTNRILDRFAGFIIVFVLVLGFTGLAFDYLCVKGPSESFRNFWLRTFSETRRFQFVNNLFLSEKELNEVGINNRANEEEIMIPTYDGDLLKISDEKTDINDISGNSFRSVTYIMYRHGKGNRHPYRH